MTPSVDPARAGFTLVETIVAFLILALVLTAAFRGASDGLGGEAHADFQRAALTMARSRLETLGLSDPLRPGTTSGRFENGFDWTLVVARASPSAEEAGGVVGFWATITVLNRASGRDRLSLSTLKIGPP